MNINNYKLLEEELQKTKEELIQTKEHLNIYTMKNKKYYENNKAEHKQRVKEYQQKTNYKSDYKPTPEQKKELFDIKKISISEKGQANLSPVPYSIETFADTSDNTNFYLLILVIILLIIYINSERIKKLF